MKKAAPLLLDVQFDPEVAASLRALGHDVVQVEEEGVDLQDALDRVLVTIDGGGPVDSTAAQAHGGVQMRVDGPLDLEQQLDLGRRLARAIYRDESGQLYLTEPGEDDVGDA